jgi:hypothetical protein
MFRSQLIFFICLVLLAEGCRNGSSKDFPEEKKLENFPATQFVPALEEKVKKGKNVIYAMSFLLAWNELRNQIGKPISTSVPQLKGVDQSDGYEDISAGKNDVKVGDGKVSIAASFQQSVSFAYPMERIKSTFQGKAVRAFGYEDGIAGGVKLLYYKSDDEFILSIQTHEKEEMLLAKGFAGGRSLRVMLNNISVAIKIGSKHSLNTADVLIIPVLRFNLSASYPAMENSFITANNKQYQIEKATQRTAFVLNETGDKAAGKAEVSDGVAKPKQLLFDKPFVVLLKKPTAVYPYFMMKVDNTELMMPLN